MKNSNEINKTVNGVLPELITAKPVIRHPETEAPFDGRPHVSLYDYIMAKQTIKMCYRFPEMDVARRGPEMDLIIWKREVGEARNNLQELRKSAAVKHKQFRAELGEVKRKDLRLRDDFLRFNQFIRENQEKRERAAKMIEVEKENQRILDEEINETQSKIGYYKKVIESLKEAIEKYNIYKVFMKDVAANSLYEDEADILKQHEAIMMTKDKVSQYHRRQLGDLSDTIDTVRKLRQDLIPETIKFNVRLHVLRKSHEKSRMLTEFWQSKISKMKQVVHTTRHELSAVQACCWDMYRYLARKREVTVNIARCDTAEQLVFVKAAILEHRRIVELARVLAEREGHSDLVTRGTGPRVPAGQAESSVPSTGRLVKLYPAVVEANTDD